MDLKNGAGAVNEGETVKPECTLELSNANFMAMTRGEVKPEKLYFGGDLKISGDVMASQKLTFLQKINPKEAAAAIAKAKAERSTASAAPAAPVAPPKQAAAPAIFAALGVRLAAEPALAAEVGAVLQFTLKAPEAHYTVDLSAGARTVVEGVSSAPDSTFTLSDDDLAALVRDEREASDLFQRGALRVDGDLSNARKLGFLKGLL